MTNRPRPARRRRLLIGLVLVLFGCALLAATDMLPTSFLPDTVPIRPPDDPRIPIAVLGDSDSHGYRDRSWWPTGSHLRGGAYRETTLQWTEVLSDLRSNQVDFGDVGTWGSRRRVAQLLALFGIDRRAPQKQDHQYNFAFGAAHCHDLSTGLFRQVPRLLEVMRHQPERWRNGVVILRIGIVNLGGAKELEQMAQDPTGVELTEKIRSCTGHITDAVDRIRAQHPTTRILLVGILNNADYPPLWDRWQSAAQIENIDRALDRFDDALRQLTERHPGMAFFDDRAWFRARWGSRGPDGKPAYQKVAIGSVLEVAHASGDAPTNSVLADGHAGMVWNMLWAQSLSATLARDLDLPIDMIEDREVQQLVTTLLAAANH